MKKRLKKAIFLLFTILVIVIAIIATFFSLKKAKSKEKIENVIEYFSDEKIEERLETNENTEISTDELMLKMDDESVIGVIKIEKIDFEGLIYDGTSLDVLEKGVGHFENSPYYDGNVCLAAHNSNKFWAKLYTLEIGDEIQYISFLGTRRYEVAEMTEILEDEWTKVENSNENMITLITCVKGRPELRLCVQAKEIK